jgi:acyl-CoA hydrolase
MVIGIRVEAENIQTGKTKHCNCSYFTMVAKDENGDSVSVPGLVISNLQEVRRFYNCLKRIALKKENEKHEEIFDFTTKEALAGLEKYNVQIQFK